MELPADIFAQLTQAVIVTGQDAPREADRRAPRVRLSNHVFGFRWDEPQSAIGLRVRDLSTGGAGIFHHERLSLDDKLVLRFELTSKQELLLLGKVIYWEPLSQQMYGVGLAFERIIESSEWARHRSQSAARPPMGLFNRLKNAVSPARRMAS